MYVASHQCLVWWHYLGCCVGESGSLEKEGVLDTKVVLCSVWASSTFCEVDR